MSDPGIVIGGEDGVDLTAAEYALGVLDGHDYTRARERMTHDAHFAREVALWEDRLADLVDEVPAVEPASGLWPRIERRLDGLGTVVDFKLRRSLAMWRMSAGLAAAVAASLAVVLMWPQPPGPLPAAPGPVLTARLTASTGPTAFVAVLDPDRHEIVLTPATITAAANRSPELWLIPEGGAPISLGVGTFDHAVRLKPRVDVGGLGRLTLAVTLEPVGGSPTGKPTGPVVAKGELEKI